MRELFNWKTQTPPPFSEKLQALIGLLKSVFHTYWPTLDDCQQLFITLFTSEERDRIWLETKKLTLGPGGGSLMENQDWVEEIFPSLALLGPQLGGREGFLDSFHWVFLLDVKAAVQIPTNLSKVTEVTQGLQDSLMAFLERLCEAYSLHSHWARHFRKPKGTHSLKPL